MHPAYEQRLPIKREDGPCTQDLVIADIEERKKIGLAKYGTLLRPFNGRDSIVDAYQESLDMTIYLRNEIEKRKLQCSGSSRSSFWQRFRSRYLSRRG